MNWHDFLEDNRIEYVSRGPNTARDHISVRCPWCGELDPSQHMGISLSRDAWGCLRDPAHRGLRPLRLVAALLGCSIHAANSIVEQYSKSDPGGLEGALLMLEATSDNDKPAAGPPIEEPPLLRPIKADGSTGRFWQYLRSRGFTNIRGVIDQYDLKCCVSGRYKDRIIFPFYRGNELYAWTGRAITDPKEAPRYLSSNHIKRLIFNEEELDAGGDKLIICEGPFDAVKLDFYGQQHKARATCTFGTSVSYDQLNILRKLSKRFEKVLVMFDRDAVAPGFMTMDWLYQPNVFFGHIPPGVKDPGDMDPEQIAFLLK